MGVPILGGWGEGLTTWEKFPRFIVFCSGGPPLSLANISPPPPVDIETPAPRQLPPVQYQCEICLTKERTKEQVGFNICRNIGIV